MTSEQLIKKLNLQPHPEGGWYRETYRSSGNIQIDGNKSRNISTAIYFLLEGKDRSCFHRIRSDELWFFHQGETIEIFSIREGKLHTQVLGSNHEQGESLQAIIPANNWFAARIKSGSGFALVSCTVSPGFDFADFELAKRSELTRQYPDLREIIETFSQ